MIEFMLRRSVCGDRITNVDMMGNADRERAFFSWFMILLGDSKPDPD